MIKEVNVKTIREQINVDVARCFWRSLMAMAVAGGGGDSAWDGVDKFTEEMTERFARDGDAVPDCITAMGRTVKDDGSTRGRARD
jgi:hypothetical protein